MQTFILNTEEQEFLFRQDSAARSDGGWQSLLVKLQDQFDTTTMQITVDDIDLERIQRYAFDYGNGGWEGRLTAVFGRHLGAQLGRPQ